jgi:hypothetical protein
MNAFCIPIIANDFGSGQRFGGKCRLLHQNLIKNQITDADQPPDSAIPDRRPI